MWTFLLKEFLNTQASIPKRVFSILTVGSFTFGISGDLMHTQGFTFQMLSWFETLHHTLYTAFFFPSPDSSKCMVEPADETKFGTECPFLLIV